jgi:hypothetical protein
MYCHKTDSNGKTQQSKPKRQGDEGNKEQEEHKKEQMKITIKRLGHDAG